MKMFFPPDDAQESLNGTDDGGKLLLFNKELHFSQQCNVDDDGVDDNDCDDDDDNDGEDRLSLSLCCFEISDIEWMSIRHRPEQMCHLAGCRQ